MNNIYLYDGNFQKLLSLLIYLLKNKIKPTNIKLKNYNGSLFDYLINLDLNYKNVIDIFIKEFGYYNFQLIYNVFISNEENKEIIIYYYLLNYSKYREKLPQMRNLKCVREVLRISKKVKNEAHRFKGFLRFKELKNHILYATMSPDNNIIEILSLHFKKRLKNEYWLIKDEKRKIISIYDKKEFYILSENNINLTDLILSENELEIEDLWKTFYSTISIKERQNDRCRMNFMPKKYWQYILEVSDK